VVFNHHTFISRSPTFINRRHTFINRGAPFQDSHDFRGHFDHRADRGFVAPHMEAGGRPGAFSGMDRGGMVNDYSFRGQSSFGRGMHGGGFAGEMHGGFGGHAGFGGGFHGGGGGHR
jgi:hypothetical protein